MCIFNNMNHKLIAVVHKEENMYVADCPEIGTVSQGNTEEEAVKNLKEATELYLEVHQVKHSIKSSILSFEVFPNAKTSKSVRC